MQVHPVSFVLQAGQARLVSMANDDGSPLRRTGGNPESVAWNLLTETIEELTTLGLVDAPAKAKAGLIRSSSRYLELAGAETSGDDVELIYTTPLPMPMAEEGLSILSGSPFTWRRMGPSRGSGSGRVPSQLVGTAAVVLDWWRQAFEETDIALDFVGTYVSLHQLRSMYDAIWGHPQDPSGFKRWAVDRPGAFQGLLVPVADHEEVEAAFYEGLGRFLPPEGAARAGGLAAAGVHNETTVAMALPLAVTAASTVNRLYKQRGPEPTWYRKAPHWQVGPTWIEHLYPPRPSWTTWESGQGHARRRASSRP